eukprot:jgi/Mesvir1/25703/Mv25976-RA.1
MHTPILNIHVVESNQLSSRKDKVGSFRVALLSVIVIRRVRFGTASLIFKF